MSHEIRMVRGSVEYLYADIRADQILDEHPVYMSVSDTNEPGTWVLAQWVGLPGKFRSARILVDNLEDAGVYHVFAQVINSPEAPIIYAGRLRVI